MSPQNRGWFEVTQLTTPTGTREVRFQSAVGVHLRTIPFRVLKRLPVEANL